MKSLFSLPLIILLFSCSGKEKSDRAQSENILENLTYAVDTVVVDSGEDFLNLSSGIFPNGQSEDLSKLYFFESNPYKLVEVDLDDLEVLKKTEFEAEGPDGLGSYLSQLEVGPTGKHFLKSNSIIGLFDQNARKLKNLRIVPTGIDSILAKNFSALYSKSVYDFCTQKIYSQPSFQDARDNILIIINTETKEAHSLPVPKMKIVDDYSGTYTFESEKGTMIAFHFVGSFITLFPEEVIISTAAFSGVYRLDIQTEELEFIDIQHQTVPNEMKVEIPENPSDPEQIRQIQNEIFQNVNFLEMLWDDTRQLYFRLGEKTFRGNSREDPITYEYYLFAYDKDFQVIGETKLEGLESNLKNMFFKEGKLWSYVNVEDELGFAVFTFDI
ncbi:DUF4221 family protein [Algoriphagus sp. PAP.12]|uniref:DUF4221 family protein n=1 Tax=Algoriphagus sp. PAP.12 TaxID=2996678 RepID=UPI00227AB88B|nr:DUF4221 family protein [Algoriphagus sp. PAP.12]